MSILLKQFINNANKVNVEADIRYKKNLIVKNNIYEQVTNLSRSEKMYYLFFALIIFYLFHQITINTNYLLASLLIFGSLYYWINSSSSEHASKTEDFQVKLEYLESFLFNSDIFNRRKNTHKDILLTLPNNMPPERKSHLHMSKPIVEFYYSIRELSQYNPSSYSSSLNAMNNILHLNIVLQTDSTQAKYTLENAKLQSDRCLNSLQSIILSLPSSETYNKFFNNSLKSLQRLTNLYLNAMTDIVQKTYEHEKRTNTINIDSCQVLTDAPNPNDTKAYNYSEHFDFY